MLQFPLPETQKNLLQFIGLANYFRDHVPRMTEMFIEGLQGLRKARMDLRGHRSVRVLSAGHLELPSSICSRIRRPQSFKQIHPTMESEDTSWSPTESPCGPLLQQSTHWATTELVCPRKGMLRHLISYEPQDRSYEPDVFKCHTNWEGITMETLSSR